MDSLNNLNNIVPAPPAPPSFKEQIISLYHKGVEKFEALQATPYFQAAPSIFMVISKIVELANHIFSTIKSESLPILYDISNTFNDISNGITDKFHDLVAKFHEFSPKLHAFSTKVYEHASKVFAAFGVISLGNIFFKTKENIEKRNAARESGDRFKILKADLEGVALASEYLAAPTIIHDFLKVCGVVTTQLSALATKVCSAVAFIFSTVSLIQSGVSCLETTELETTLKRARHLAFLQAYFQNKGLNSSKQQLEKLSSSKLKERVKVIKKKLINSQQDVLLNKIVQISNQAFIKTLEDKISKDPDIIKDHFGVTFEEKAQKDIEPAASNQAADVKADLHQNFFKKLSSDLVRNDPVRLGAAVKNLKLRLQDSIRSHKFSVLTNSINIASGAIGLAIVIGATSPFLAPVSAVLTLIAAAGTIANIFITHQRKQNFITAMESITTPKPQALNLAL